MIVALLAAAVSLLALLAPIATLGEPEHVTVRRGRP
jgi:hypothetical protein